MASIHLPNLTELHLEYFFEGSRLAHLLSLLPKLCTCNIHALKRVSDPEPLGPSNLEIRSSFELRFLSLGMFDGSSPQGEDVFFHSLSLPHLETIHLMGETK